MAQMPGVGIIFADMQLKAVTSDPEAMLAAISGISVYGGGDCPEMAMTGIKLALDNSRRCDLYVCTDASAKDAGLASTVISLAQKKQCQVHKCCR